MDDRKNSTVIVNDKKAKELQKAVSNYTEFKTKIDSMSSQEIDEYLFVKDDSGETAFQYTATGNSWDLKNSFIELIKNASAESINKALCLQDNKGRTIFHGWAFLIFGGSEEAFIELIKKASPEAINEVLSLQQSGGFFFLGWTVLHCAARRQRPGVDVFMALINKASSEAINQALLLQYDREKLTPLHLAALYQSPESIKALLEKSSAYAICTAILKEHREITLAPKNISEEIEKRIPLFLQALQNPQIIKNNADSFIKLLKEIFNDELKAENMALDDCKKWLDFLNKALPVVSNEEARNFIEAKCAQLNWIIYSKKKSSKSWFALLKTINSKNTFRNNAIKHANNITSPIGLSVADNYLLAELYRSQTKDTNAKQLRFLHQDVIDFKPTNNEDDIHNQVHTRLFEIVFSIIEPESNIFRRDENKTDWTEDDEEKYQKALYYLEAKEYLDAIEREMGSLEKTMDLHKTLTQALATTRKALGIEDPKETMTSNQGEIETKDPEKIAVVLTTFKDTCLPKTEAFMKTLPDEKIIYFLKKLHDCILAIPLFGTGIIHASKLVASHSKNSFLFQEQHNAVEVIHKKLLIDHKPPPGKK